MFASVGFVGTSFQLVPFVHFSANPFRVRRRPCVAVRTRARGGAPQRIYAARPALARVQRSVPRIAGTSPSGRSQSPRHCDTRESGGGASAPRRPWPSTLHRSLDRHAFVGFHALHQPRTAAGSGPATSGCTPFWFTSALISTTASLSSSGTALPLRRTKHFQPLTAAERLHEHGGYSGIIRAAAHFQLFGLFVQVRVAVQREQLVLHGQYLSPRVPFLARPPVPA